MAVGGADRDVAEIREEFRTGMHAHTQALNALGATQRELAEAQVEMRESLRDHGDRITTLETTMRSGFAEMRTGMAPIVTLLGGAPPA